MVVEGVNKINFEADDSLKETDLNDASHRLRPVCQNERLHRKREFAKSQKQTKSLLWAWRA